MHKFKFIALIYFLLINIYGMESGAQSNELATENTKLLEEVVVEKFNTQLINSDQNLIKLGIKTDSDFIRLLPTEVWLNIIQYLHPKDEALLYFFAPILGATDKQAKVIAVNISNFAALNCKSLDEWEDRINNACKFWGNLKNYKDNNKFAEKSKTKIRRYLKILNSNFFKTLDIYKKALTSNYKKAAFKRMWSIAEADLAKILKLQNIEYEYGEPLKFSKNQARAYLEVQKYLIFKKYTIINDPMTVFCFISGYFLWSLFPLFFLLPGFDSNLWIYIELGVQGFFIFLIIFSCISNRKNLKEYKNLIFRKKSSLQNFRIPFNVDMLDERLFKCYFAKYKDAKTLNLYEAEMLEFLNEQLKTATEELSLDKLLTEALKDTKDAPENLKEEEQLVANS